MEILLTAVVAAAVAAAVVLVTQRARPARQPVAVGAPPATESGAREGSPREGAGLGEPPGRAGGPDGDDDGATASAPPGPARPPAAVADPEPQSRGGLRTKDDREELRARRAELGRIEERLRAKEQSAEARLAELDGRERSLDDRQRNLDLNAKRLKEAKHEQIRELERLASLSASQAKQILLVELEDELRHESARLIRQVEEEARRDAEGRARNILSTCMQRVAGGHAVETTVSVVELQSDELKGRVIGREGRNIRALETLTGIDFIVDDTPSAVVLSGFDGVRREIARLTLEKLLQDGRIHPARIEEAYQQAKSEIGRNVVEVGEQALFEANVGTLHPELTKVLGRLKYRTSYSQNVLAHSIECARLAGMLAAELGASPKTAARAALLHDIGKALTHEVEGSHALIGGELARRYKESEAVAHAMEAHHNEIEPQTVEAVIVQIADALSGARPGARGESLEHYVSRLHELEELATRRPGVEKVYAMHAGREIRVIVKPEEIDDDEASLLSHQIARDVEQQLEYPGQIKITVIRERRATDYAK